MKGEDMNGSGLSGQRFRGIAAVFFHKRMKTIS